MKNILLVIEDRRLHSEIKNILGFYTFHTISGYNQWESIRLVQEQYPDFIITDLNVFSKNSFEVLKELRELTLLSRTPILLLSNQINKDFCLKIWSIGIWLFLPKTTNMRNLVQILEQETRSIG